MRIAFSTKIVTDGSKQEEIVTGRSISGNTIIDTVYLEVESTAGITLKGSLDSDNTVSVTAINMSGFETVDTISEAGLYCVPTEGLNKLLLDIQGASVINVRGLY